MTTPCGATSADRAGPSPRSVVVAGFETGGEAHTAVRRSKGDDEGMRRPAWSALLAPSASWPAAPPTAYPRPTASAPSSTSAEDDPRPSRRPRRRRAGRRGAGALDERGRVEQLFLVGVRSRTSPPGTRWPRDGIGGIFLAGRSGHRRTELAGDDRALAVDGARAGPVGGGRPGGRCRPGPPGARLRPAAPGRGRARCRRRSSRPWPSAWGRADHRRRQPGPRPRRRRRPGRHGAPNAPDRRVRPPVRQHRGRGDRRRRNGRRRPGARRGDRHRSSTSPAWAGSRATPTPTRASPTR